MSDKELIEWAARAAEYRWKDVPDRPETNPGLWLTNPMHTCWNPLADDAAALRLAVKLDIRFSQHFAMVQAEYPWIEDYCTRKVLCEGVLDDYCAATRRAIVRAAAELGRKVGAPQ